ncbi:hypothetical protein [Oceanihabitans sediminis]|uniref:hypothetical protein n=1 Tax=Oceanihabitans sediminis TaxID=1812012 RepID=UPI003A8F42E4
MEKQQTIKINLDKFFLNAIVLLLVLKLLFSYLNIELDWWQRHLIPNFEKFNFLNLPKNIGKILEFFTFPLLVAYLLKNIGHLKNMSIIIFILLIMGGFNIATSTFNSIPVLKSLEYTIKLMSPMLLFMVLTIHVKKYDYDLGKLMIRILLFCAFLTLIGYLFFDVSFNHNRNWLPIYFTSLHTHSYVLVIIAIGLSYKMYEKKKYLYFFIFSISFFLFLYLGHRIRTTLVFYLVYIMAVSYTINDIFKVLWAKLLVNIPILIVLFLVLKQDFNLNQFSSGRLTMYEAKYEMLSNYSLPEYMLGRGKGADFIKTEDWWYDEKNSHNDILTFIVENGIPYTILFLGLILILMAINGKIRIIYSGILLGYLLTSLLSNGLVLRPLAGYLLFIVLAYINYSYNKNIKEDVALQ